MRRSATRGSHSGRRSAKFSPQKCSSSDWPIAISAGNAIRAGQSTLIELLYSYAFIILAIHVVYIFFVPRIFINRNPTIFIFHIILF